jgi:hypothetical protein
MRKGSRGAVSVYLKKNAGSTPNEKAAKQPVLMIKWIYYVSCVLTGTRRYQYKCRVMRQDEDLP